MKHEQIVCSVGGQRQISPRNPLVRWIVSDFTGHDFVSGDNEAYRRDELSIPITEIVCPDSPCIAQRSSKSHTKQLRTDEYASPLPFQ
jgi:hypothetical protein